MTHLNKIVEILDEAKSRGFWKPEPAVGARITQMHRGLRADLN